MVVKFYNLNKRPNSTKQPAANSELITCSSVDLKDECSFQNPILRIRDRILNTNFIPSNYNYAYISAWNRYYFIRDWVYVNAAWEVYLSVDVLASFKTAIGTTQAYVVRSASHYNGNLVDTFYPTSCVKSVSKQSVSSEIYHTSLPNGSYIIGVINNSSSNYNIGAIKYYALTTAQLNSLLQYLFSSNIFNNSNITEMGEGLYKSLFNPFQYIVSCMWFPFEPISFGDSTESMKVGYWDTGVTGTRVHHIVKEMNFKTDSPIAAHPLAATRGAYMNYSPYTTLTLFYPPFGEIPIDTTFNQYTPNTYLWGKIFVDAITGKADCYVTLTNGSSTDGGADPYRYMTMRSAQLGVPIQLAQVMSDYVSTAASAGGVLSNLLSFNIGAIFNNIASGVSAAFPKVSTTGSNGAFVEIIEAPYLVCEYASVASENVTEFGRPLCDTRTINTLSGYVQCGQGNYSFEGTEFERKTINEFITNGFFYE